MKKFSFKGHGKHIMQEIQPIALGTAGVIAAQKFLDFKTLFPNMAADNMLIKHEGLVKIAGVIVALSVAKKMNPMIKYALYGIAIQGGIKAVRQYTSNAEGTSFVTSIGVAEFDEQIKSLAAEVKTVANEFGTSVGAGVNRYWENSPAVALNKNAATSVGGMGMGDDPVSGVGGF
jgi:hypothetical protein